MSPARYHTYCLLQETIVIEKAVTSKSLVSFRFVYESSRRLPRFSVDYRPLR